MNFNSVNYIIFLPIVAVGYFVIPQKLRNIYMLAVSYYFYFCSEVRFFLLLPVLTAIDYLAALKMDGAGTDKERKAVFLLSLILNIGTLVFFKYNRFFLAEISALTGITFNLSNWTLPVGISFYVFTASSYLIDVYLKKYRAEKRPVEFALYIAFFPHILMGPIDRANKFIPQLDREHKFDYDRVRKALQLMAIGFFKKIACADVLAMSINRVHADLYSYKGLILVLTAVLYSFQLYADFSGYCDIARGSAMIFGIDIAENFNTPYLSSNFSLFWSRWHISLSSWFQDYIFTPFVWTNPLKKLGKAFEKPPVLLAVTIVFVTSGVWHGNTWNFVIWGCFHAFYRVCEELIHRKFGKPKKKQPPLQFWSKVAAVFSLTTFCQIFFRCPDIPSALYYIKNLFADLSLSSLGANIMSAVRVGFDATPLLMAAYIAFNIITLAMLIIMDLTRMFKLKGKCLTGIFDAMKPWQRWLCYYGLVALIMAGFIMNNGGYGASRSFIYNNF